MNSIFIYDDNKSRVESLMALIGTQSHLKCVGFAANCGNVISDMQQNQPNIVLMDIEMPFVNGLTGAKVIKQRFPEIKVIMQTAFDDTDKIFEALQNGAVGYILKSASVQTILQSIDEVSRGGAFMSPSVAIKVARFFSEQEKTKDYNLSNKESEVLEYLAKGHSYKMVADEMGISYFTVNNHVKKIYEKLQVHSLGEAVAMAHRERLI